MGETKRYGYARISASMQDLAPQLTAIQQFGVKSENIYSDTSMRVGENRPQFNECIRTLASGDTLVIWKLDRLGRSIQEIIEIVRMLQDQKINLISLEDNLNTATPEGQLFFAAAGAIIEYDTNLSKERAMVGLAEAKEKGIRGGRRHKLTEEQQKIMLENVNQGVPAAQIMADLGIGKSAYYEYLKILKGGKSKQ